MQISLDIRWHDETTAYGRFVLNTLSQFIEPESDTSYILYTNQDSKAELPSNVKIVSAPQKKDKLLHQLKFRKMLESDNSNLYIFFDEFVPFWFKKNFLVIIPNLTEVFFPNLGFIDDFIYKKYLDLTLKNAEIVLCFENNTALELNERLNVMESKIHTLPGFFSSENVKTNPDVPKLDIQAKYNIDNWYLLYDARWRANNNFERVLKIFEKLDSKGVETKLLIISEPVTKDVSLRQKALDMWIETKVLFVWEVPAAEEVYYYTQSSGVIFPSIYGSFPFEFSKAMSYNTPIIASDLKSTTEIMQDTISYFNARSTSESTRQIEDFLANPNKSHDYTKLHKRLSPEISAQKLKDHVTNWEELPSWK